MLSLYAGFERLGPYFDSDSPHDWGQSAFHRSPEFCGSCHDVSNPVVGDLAHNSGAQRWADPVLRSGVPGTPVETKAAFNNFPYMYGVVERTFSENMASAFPTLRVRDFANLPAELQTGELAEVYQKALAGGPNGDYADGTPRFFTCQTCHLSPANGRGASFGRERSDIPVHDLTGGNYWAPDLIQNLDSRGKLRLGSGLTNEMIDAMTDGKDRAIHNLRESVAMSITGNTVRIANLTGHKLISGYPEGRRMWLNIKWFDRKNRLIREDGEYGDLNITICNKDLTVRTILNHDDPNTIIFQAHTGMTKEWARQLRQLGFPAGLALAYDRITGEVVYTLGNLANQPPGTEWETMHFVLNNTILHDNRIPPYGFSYDEARKRNTLPVPPTQYGDPGPGGVFDYFKEFSLNPPAGAISARVDLLYQPTSWEYVQFLFLANDRSNQFLANVGEDLLDGWLATGMAEPVVMATVTWRGSSGVGGGDAGSKVKVKNAKPIKP